MKDIILYAELIVSVLLALVILIQPKSSSGMGSMAGEDGVEVTKRGGEKLLHTITIVLAIAFAVLAVIYHIL